jgi:hypothetical protein
MCKDVLSRPKRQAVLIVADGNYIEVFGDGVDVHVAKIPQAGTVGMEDLAEHCLLQALPLRFRSLFDRSKLRGNAYVAPLRAEVAQDALRLKRMLAAFTAVSEKSEAAA